MIINLNVPALNAAIEAYNDYIINGIIWTQLKFVFVDVLINAAMLSELVKALKKNELYYEIEQLVNRTTSYQTRRTEKCRVWGNLRYDIKGMDNTKDQRIWKIFSNWKICSQSLCWKPWTSGVWGEQDGVFSLTCNLMKNSGWGGHEWRQGSVCTDIQRSIVPVLLLQSGR